MSAKDSTNEGKITAGREKVEWKQCLWKICIDRRCEGGTLKGKAEMSAEEAEPLMNSGIHPFLS